MSVSIHTAAALGDLVLVQAALQGGGGQPPVDINTRDAAGMTALHHAARHGWKDVVAFLMRNGADMEVVDRGGNRPWMVAQNDELRYFMVGPQNLPINPYMLRQIASTSSTITLTFDVLGAPPTPTYFAVRMGDELKSKSEPIAVESSSNVVQLTGLDAKASYWAQAYAGGGVGLGMRGSNILNTLRPTTKVALHVLEPTEGQPVRVGTLCDVRWSCTGVLDSVDVLLMVKDQVAAIVAVGISNTGFTQFEVPMELPASTFYSIQLRPTEGVAPAAASQCFSVLGEWGLTAGVLLDMTHD